jgi:amino acid transporter
MGLAYLVASGDALQIFGYFTSSVTVFGSLTWISILASHVAFMRGMKAQGISRDTLPYKAVSRQRLFRSYQRRENGH